MTVTAPCGSKPNSSAGGREGGLGVAPGRGGLPVSSSRASSPVAGEDAVWVLSQNEHLRQTKDMALLGTPAISLRTVQSVLGDDSWHTDGAHIRIGRASCAKA